MGVHWEEYSEEEIHDMLRYVHESEGFTVCMAHKADRAREEGADLILRREGETEATAIAVKIRPRKADIHQLEELAGRPEVIKRYIYIDLPSADFRKRMDSLEQEVQFWNAEKLTRELLNRNPRFLTWLVLEWTPFSVQLFTIRQLLGSIWTKARSSDVEPELAFSDRDALLQNLWSLKDRAASLHKASKYLSKYFLEMESSKYVLDFNHQQNMLQAFLRTLKEMNSDSLDVLHWNLEEIQKRFSSILLYVAHRTCLSSIWIWIFNFNFALGPGGITEHIEEREKGRSSMVELRTMLKLDTRGWEKEIYRQGTILSAMEGFASLVEQTFEGIEGFVDDIFEYLTRPKEFKQINKPPSKSSPRPSE